MTLIQAINKIDQKKPSAYPLTDKVAWLSSLDSMIYNTIISTHEDDTMGSFSGYTDADLDKELIVGAPHEELYLYWLESKIDYHNAEFGRYNNAITSFNDVYKDFNNYYNRQHKPLGERVIYY